MVAETAKIFPSLEKASRKSLFGIFVIVISCWIMLALLEASPYAKYLHHQSLEYASLLQLPLLTLAFAGGWTLMIGAMMVPVLAPVILEFEKAAHKISGGSVKFLFFVSGLAAIWLFTGVLLFFSDFWLHRAVDASTFLSENPFWIPVMTIILCGMFQFTGFKKNMLYKCRPSTVSLRAECVVQCSNNKEAFQYGLRHGYFSIGSCGTFMLMMFAIDIGTIWSMALFGAIMIAERYGPHVEKLAREFGLAMLCSGVLYALFSTFHF